MTDNNRFECWCVLELMGHRRLAGYLTEVSIGGAAFVRIDIPGEDGTTVTQIYSPQAIYAITPCTEETARRASCLGRPAPVSVWELPRLPASERDEDALATERAARKDWQDEDEEPRYENDGDDNVN